jgi:hypothetical protein
VILAATSTVCYLRHVSHKQPDDITYAVILSTRGTGVPQGPEYSAIEMIAATKAAVPDGAEYDVVYPASQDQNSTAATIDVSV